MTIEIALGYTRYATEAKRGYTTKRMPLNDSDIEGRITKSRKAMILEARVLVFLLLRIWVILVSKTEFYLLNLKS